MTHPSIETTSDGDEVGRQRMKRADRVLASPVLENPEIVIGDLVDLVRAARDESADVIDVRAFLGDRGYTPRTVQTVREYLNLQTDRD
jgi:hypothetical protein